MLYRIVRRILWLYFKLVYRFEILNIENLPSKGPYMICSNHRSNWDPIFISGVIKEPIHWMAKKELFKNRIVGNVISKFYAFPVDRGASDIAAVKTALRVLKNKEVLGVFPEGTRVKEVDLNMGKSGVTVIAHKSKSLIVPVYVEGSYIPFTKMKLHIRKPIDLSYLSKPTQLEYKEYTVDLLKSIYYGVDIYRDNSGE
ncbi:lysophospholipid acyltransferase family protein [Peptoniphilus indolicus]|uniref:1-acylglycerol-3-phosphate O-acyltransferase n=2 Tax=Peptoniphilus indolicus TaxID=33030 RepID=G4D6P8_9FIRM|nr:lysophospholipid acyltransferase family protein [Peptoniphilus indolicus]EGY76442.1 1-acylglycerol-3-phosphate O-acyltransferase [Peptoniphilus indolicus ATCC 29427]SUB76062.1 1-acyl-sn-glycerol-3-phosphate acyltransferase [Peptoniphilus indolicus]